MPNINPIPGEQALVTAFASLADARRPINRRHRPSDMIVLVISAALAGADGWQDAARFRRAKAAWPHQFLVLPYSILKARRFPDEDMGHKDCARTSYGNAEDRPILPESPIRPLLSVLRPRRSDKPARRGFALRAGRSRSRLGIRGIGLGCVRGGNGSQLCTQPLADIRPVRAVRLPGDADLPRCLIGRSDPDRHPVLCIPRYRGRWSDNDPMGSDAHPSVSHNGHAQSFPGGRPRNVLFLCLPQVVQLRTRSSKCPGEGHSGRDRPAPRTERAGFWLQRRTSTAIPFPLPRLPMRLPNMQKPKSHLQ
mgnify:CR=1 FL=1